MGFIVRKRRAATLIEINIAPVRGRAELNRASVSITRVDPYQVRSVRLPRESFSAQRTSIAHDYLQRSCIESGDKYLNRTRDRFALGE